MANETAIHTFHGDDLGDIELEVVITVPKDLSQDQNVLDRALDFAEKQVLGLGCGNISLVGTPEGWAIMGWQGPGGRHLLSEIAEKDRLIGELLERLGMAPPRSGPAAS